MSVLWLAVVSTLGYALVAGVVTGVLIAYDGDGDDLAAAIWTGALWPLVLALVVAALPFALPIGIAVGATWVCTRVLNPAAHGKVWH